jgi:hypothetical protein
MTHSAEKFPWRMGVVVLQNPGALIKEFGGQLDSSETPERRHTSRVPLHVPIRYQHKGKRLDWNDAETINMSQGGVRFMTMQKDIKPGDQLGLMMKLPGISCVIELTGTIVWIKAVAQKGFTMECGVVFEDQKKR